MSFDSALDRARLALDGLSMGDAFGERFFMAPDLVLRRRAGAEPPAGSWRTTDDTEMAIAIVDVLSLRGAIDGDVDTTCAIVGGIVAMSCGREGIPAAFLAAREPLRHDADLPAG